MLAILRPDSWNFPLFLHVLGAMVVDRCDRLRLRVRRVERRWPWLRLVTARTLLLATFPAWILMRLGGAWEDSRSSIGDDSGWLGTGYIVADAGFVLLIVAMILAAVSVRQPQRELADPCRGGDHRRSTSSPCWWPCSR
jgi:protein-S-isoprenylcysteine O-methyltransferase Ste14